MFVCWLVCFLFFPVSNADPTNLNHFELHHQNRLEKEFSSELLEYNQSLECTLDKANKMAGRAGYTSAL